MENQEQNQEKPPRGMDPLEFRDRWARLAIVFSRFTDARWSGTVNADEAEEVLKAAEKLIKPLDLKLRYKSACADLARAQYQLDEQSLEKQRIELLARDLGVTLLNELLPREF